MLPSQNNMTSWPQQPVQNIRVLQVLAIRKQNIWMLKAFGHTPVTMVVCITVLLFQRQEEANCLSFFCSPAPAIWLCTNSLRTPSLFPFTFSGDTFCCFFKHIFYTKGLYLISSLEFSLILSSRAVPFNYTGVSVLSAKPF